MKNINFVKLILIIFKIYIFYFLVVYPYFSDKKNAEKYFKNGIRVKGYVYDVSINRVMHYRFKYNDTVYYSLNRFTIFEKGDSILVFFFPDNPSDSRSESEIYRDYKPSRKFFEKNPLYKIRF